MRDKVLQRIREQMFSVCLEVATRDGFNRLKPWEDGDTVRGEVSIPADVWAIAYDGAAPPTDMALRVQTVCRYHAGKHVWEFLYWQAGFYVPTIKCTHCEGGWRNGRPCDICGCTGWLGARDTWQPWTETNYFEWGSGPVTWTVPQ